MAAPFLASVLPAQAFLRRPRRGLSALLLVLPLLAGLTTGAHAQSNLLSISGPADADEGDSGTRDLTFTVTLGTAETDNTDFRVCFSGTATIHTAVGSTIPLTADYRPVLNSHRLLSNCVNDAISGGSTSNTSVGIQVKGDTDFEPGETVVATLSLRGTPPAGVTLGTSVVTHTIRNDDAASLSPLPPGAPEYSFWITGGPPIDEGGEAVFTVHANPAPAAQMEVGIMVTAAPVRSNFLNFGDTGIRTVRFSAGSGTAVYRARTRGDDTDEPDGFVRARLHSNKATVGGRAYWQHSPKKSAEVRVWDDDAPLPQHQPPVISVRTLPGRGTVDEGETAYFCYGIEGDGYPANHPSRFWVRYEAVSSSGRVLIEDAALGLGTATREMCLKRSTWGAAGETWTARVLPPSGPIFNQGRQIQPYAVGTATATATVAVRGGTSRQVAATPPSVTISTDAASVTEGGEVTFTVTADPAPGNDITVHLGAAEEMGEGLNYIGREQTGTVTLPADATSATWTVTAWSDEQRRADGTVEARIKPGDGYTAGTPSTVTVALLDDDGPPEPVATQQPAPAVDPSLVAQVRILAGQTHHGAAHVTRWRRVLVAFGVEAYPGVTAMTAAQAEANARRYSSPLWPRIVAAIGAIGAIGAAGSDPAPEPVATQQTAPAVDPSLVALVRSYAAETHNGRDHVERWMRVLAAFGEDNGRAPMTAAEARVLEATHNTSGRWTAVVAAIAALEAAPEPEPETQPVVPPTVSVAAGAAVSEGGGAVFTLTAAPAPASPLAVEVTVGAEGDFGIAAGARTVTIPASGSLVLTLATVDDGADEPDGSVSVTLNDGNGYTVGSAASGTVAVADDDLPPPEVSIAAKAGSITEGAGAVFTVTADRAPDAALAVRLTVSEAAGSDFVAAGDEGGRTVTIPAGTTGVALTVATDDDAADEPDGSVSAAVDAGDGYTVAASPGDAASVAVADNDAAATVPALSIDDATGPEGKAMMFAIRLSAPSERTVRALVKAREANPVSARANRDFVAARYQVTFRPGETVQKRWFYIIDDSHDDGDETFEVHVAWADGAPVGDGVGVGTIENADPLPAAFLSRFGRTVAEQALDGIAGRMAAPRTAGMQGTLAGQALGFDPAASGEAAAGATPANREAAPAMTDIVRGLGADASAPAGPGSATGPFGDTRAGTSLAQSRSMTARDILLGSSFTLTGATDGSGGSLAFWGRASQGSFDGAERGDGTDITLDGTVTTGMLGTDYARGNWLVGLALTQSSAEGGYGAIGGNDVDPCPGTEADAALCDGAVRSGDGDVEASLTAAVPYAALQASERLKLWGAAGYGSGEVTLKPAMGERYGADTRWSMAAAGMRGNLLEVPKEGSGPALALTSDALWTRTSSERTRDLAATDSDATRLRLGLEGSWRVAMEDGAHLTPKLEVGARHDGGDAETGIGVEVGGGIAWSDPALGLSLDVSGRTLLAHENDDLKDRGVSAALAFDPDPATQRGPSFALRQELGGRANGGLDALFAPAPLEERSGNEATSRWAMEAAYGFPAFGGRFTGSPHVGLGLATGARDYSVGWRLTPEAASAPDLSFGLRATRRESATAEPEHAMGLEITAHW